MCDTYGWKLVWAQDADGEIGKTPPLPAGCVEIDLLRPCVLEAGFGQARGRK